MNCLAILLNMYSIITIGQLSWTRILTGLPEDTVARKVWGATSQLLNIIYIELICSVCSQNGIDGSIPSLAVVYQNILSD